MHDRLLRLYIRFQTLVSDERGQDMVEYGLLVALIALTMISGINSLAGALNRFFSKVSTSLA